jgi:hypothetical protein
MAVTTLLGKYSHKSDDNFSEYLKAIGKLQVPNLASQKM